MHSDLWVEEKCQDFYGARFKVEKVLFSGKSDFQTVDVVETKGHGRMLLNDGLVMISERDEFVYHDMITHVPLFTHPNPKKILIIGGGDGGTAREVLRHQSVEECVMVEIDPIVVKACKEHIPQTSKDLDHPKLELLIEDGVKYVKETNKKFDVVLVDSTEPFGPAEALFNVDFYKDVFNCLNDDGIVVSQGESPFYDPENQKHLMSILNQLFPKVLIYNYNNLTYPGSLWSFTYASKGLDPRVDFNSDRIKQSGLEFEYYNEDIHKASFALPNFMRKNLEGLLKE